MIDLSNDWLRRDTGTNSVYYGYSDSLTSNDSSRSWSILKLTTVGTVDSVSWSDNAKFEYNAIWSQRVANFATPSGSLGITFSKTQDTFNNVSIDASFSFLSGVNIYKISIVDQNNVLYGNFKNPKNQPFQNTYNAERFTEKLIGINKYNFVGSLGMTYSLTVTGINQIGITLSTVTITT